MFLGDKYIVSMNQLDDYGLFIRKNIVSNWRFIEVIKVLRLRNRKHFLCPLKLWLYSDKWTFGRTLKAVETRAISECFYSCACYTN